MAGVAPYYNSDTLIKQKMFFLLEEGDDHLLLHHLGIQWRGVLVYVSCSVTGFTALSGHLGNEVVLCAPSKCLI